MVIDEPSFLAAVVEESADSIITVDCDGIITSWNKATERLYGYSATEVLGKHLSLLSFAGEFSKIANAIEVINNGGTVDRFETDRRRKDGRRISISAQFSPIHDSNGHLIGISTISRDVTRRKEILVERDRLFEVAADLLVVGNMEGVLKWASPSWEKTTGWRVQDLTSQPWINFVHPDDREATLVQAEKAMRGEAITFFENRYRKKDGTYIWLNWKTKTFPSEGLIYGAATNIDQRKKAEEQLRASEERFRKLFSSASIGLALIDLKKRYVRVNVAFCELTGYSEQELLQRTVIDIQHPDDAPRALDLLRRLQNGEISHFDIEKRYIRKTGEVIWVRTKVCLLTDENGQPHFFGAIQDITERKRLEQALRRNEEHLRVILETAKDFAIFSMDVEGRVLTWNHGAENTFGYSENEVIRRNIDADIFVPEEVEAGVPEQERATATQTGAALDERWHKKKDGQRFFASGVMRPMFDDRNKLQGFVKVARDITSRVQMENDLRTARENLEKTVQQRTRELQTKIGELEAFSYTVSHDLRAPLRAMQAFSEFLLADYADQLDEEGKAYLRRIKSSADRLELLIQDILAYSRVARIRIDLEPVQLDTLVSEIMKTFPNLQNSKAVIDTRTPLHPVIGHRPSLLQCLSNLIGNAVKFVSPGTHPHITIWTERIEQRVRIYVKDNGIGIEPAFQSKIFNIFERIHRADLYEGTGIGLAIVRKAVERMGGQVGVQSELGKGSTFWIELNAADPPVTNDNGKAPPLQK